MKSLIKEVQGEFVCPALNERGVCFIYKRPCDYKDKTQCYRYMELKRYELRSKK
jgi:hypothetical protein